MESSNTERNVVESQARSFYQKWWFWVIAAVLVVAIINAITGNTTPTASPTPESTISEEEAAQAELIAQEREQDAADQAAEEAKAATLPSETPTATPEPTITTDPNTPAQLEIFSRSTRNGVAAIDRDLTQLAERAKNGRSLRLAGNIIQIGASHATLTTLTPPDASSAAWTTAIANIDKNIEKLREGVSAVLAEEQPSSHLTPLIASVRHNASTLGAIAAQHG